jgi:hypothetical protein
MTTAAPLAQRDIGALIGLLAVLEGSVLVGDLPLDQGLRLRRRLVDVGLLSADQPYSDLAGALGALNQRLRRLELPGSTSGRDEVVENVIAFGDAPAALAFVDRLRSQGRDVDDPVPEDSLRRWTVVTRLHVRDGDPFTRVGPDAAAARELGGWHLGAS